MELLEREAGDQKRCLVGPLLRAIPVVAGPELSAVDQQEPAQARGAIAVVGVAVVLGSRVAGGDYAERRASGQWRQPLPQTEYLSATVKIDGILSVLVGGPQFRVDCTIIGAHGPSIGQLGNQMPRFDYDLYVIGAGSGGVRGSRIAAGLGAKVGICEESRVGGTCVIRGCVPKKLLSYAAHFAEEFEQASGFGWTVADAEFDWSTLIANKDAEIDRLNGIYKSLLNNAGVELHEARGVLEDPHTVSVGGKSVTAERILIAVGGWPSKPAIAGAELAITSNEAFHLDQLPSRIVIYGGGYIAVEFASIFNGLGSDVTLVYRGPQVLRGFDDDVRRFLGAEMRKKGIKLKLDTTIESIDQVESGLSAKLTEGTSITADQVMFATGRRPKTDDLGLAAAGISLNQAGSIPVNRFSQTQLEPIYAVGDVTDRINLTPVALMEGQAFAQSVYGGNPTPVDHRFVASAVFSHPPIGTVGLSEAEARGCYSDIDVYRSEFRPLKHTLSNSDEKMLMKLIVDRTSQRVMGLHVAGMDGPEIVQCAAVAIKMGATKADFDQAIGIHPTAAEELVTMRTPV